MEKAAAVQSIRNWKLLSDLKQTASSVIIKDEEVLADFSVFSNQNLHAKEQELPAYERLINRISFNNLRKPLRHKTRFLSFHKVDESQKPILQVTHQDQSKFIDLLTYFLSIF